MPHSPMPHSVRAGDTSDGLKLKGEGNRWRRRVGSYRIFFASSTY